MVNKWASFIASPSFIAAPKANFKARWLARISPYQRFSARLTAHTALLGVVVIRYVINVGLLHPLLLAGLPDALSFIDIFPTTG